MGKAILVTGGARSGKSSFAEKLAAELGGDILYIATSIPFDEEMKLRVKKHREQRPQEWDTYEGYRGLGRVIEENGSKYRGMLLDCVTVMVTNIMFEQPGMDFDNGTYTDFAKAEAVVREELEELAAGIRASEAVVIMVTNELGSGIVPENALSRAFRDIAGRANQYIAAHADEVWLTVCGIPMKIK